MNDGNRMPEVLIERFRPVLSDKADALFRDLIEYADEIEKDGSTVICRFPDEEETLKIEGPLGYAGRFGEEIRDRVRNHAPAAFRKFLGVCGEMCFGEQGEVSQIALNHGFMGTLHVAVGDAMNEYDETRGFHYDPNICSPIDIGFNLFYFIMPGREELFISDECYAVVTITTDPVEAYFRELHYELRRFDRENVFHAAMHRFEWTRAL